MLFTDQILINSLNETLGRVLDLKHGRDFQTLGQDFQTFCRALKTLDPAFESLRENQKLRREFEKLDRVFKKLGRKFVLQNSPCCPNQPRYLTYMKIS